MTGSLAGWQLHDGPAALTAAAVVPPQQFSPAPRTVLGRNREYV